MLDRALRHENSVVNQADALGKVQILNAKGSNIDVTKTYTVEAHFADRDPISLADAVYNAELDVIQSVPSPDLQPIWLTEIQYLKIAWKQ